MTIADLATWWQGDRGHAIAAGLGFVTNDEPIRDYHVRTIW